MRYTALFCLQEKFVMLRRLLVAILLLVPVFAAAQKHPFTFEDLMKLKRIGDFTVSPDGRWVAFSATDVSLEANTRKSHLWIVPLAGGDARRLTAEGEGTEDRLRFSPDGSRVLYTAVRNGVSQIYLQSFDGAAGMLTGQARPLTNLSTEADGGLWSPDGKQILFVSGVWPQCKDDACNKAKDDAVAGSKVKAKVIDHLMYRHWDAYDSGKRSHLFLASVDCGGAVCAARDLTPGNHDVPPFSLGGQDQYQFSPDGKEVAFTSNLDEVQATSTNDDVFILSLTDPAAKPVNLTAENHGSDSTPMYSPDGRWIAIRSQFRGGYESDRFRLRLIDRERFEQSANACGGAERKGGSCKKVSYITNLTEDFDRWVDSMGWAPDSKSLYITAGDAGESPVYVLSVSGGEPKLIVRGSNDSPTPTADGKTIIFERSSVRFPHELIAVSPATGRETQLTHLNDAVLSQVQMQPSEPFWFTGAKGEKVQGFMVKPPNFDPSKKYPLKFILHGGPEVPVGDEWTFRWNSNLFAAPGYVVIEINFHGSPGYGQKFVDSINGDWGGAPFQDLMLGLDYAEKTYPFIDKDRECALGASYGGFMANWILGHSDRFKCIVSHDGMFNTASAYGETEELWFNEWEFKGTPWSNPEMYRRWSPSESAAKFSTPTLVVHGQLDYRLDVAEGFQLFTTLQRRGVPSRMLYFPDEGHWVSKPQNSQLWYKTVGEWVDWFIGTPGRHPKEAPPAQ
jgi:dipeptidyl aminopeptidase/acylaminoacyl peptidase